MTASLSRLQSFYADMLGARLLRAMIREEFAGTIAVLTTFDAESALLLALVAEIDPATPVLIMDTGKHFPETAAYGESLIGQLGLEQVHILRPDPDVAAQTDPAGALWESDPAHCCHLRKSEPLHRTVEELGLLALVTGRRRDQLPQRARLPKIELDENGVFRINPLADWGRAEHDAAFAARNLPPHPLAGKGYGCIGCAPCSTFPGTDGERAYLLGFDDAGGDTDATPATDWSV